MSRNIKGMAAIMFLLCLPLLATAESPQTEKNEAGVISFKETDFSSLLGMEGFSDVMLMDHFKLYGGYVKNSNKLLVRLSELLGEGTTNTPEYAELKRRLGWEINGMRLHEYYFENLGGDGIINAEGALYKKISEDFGSFEKWKEDFIATGAMRGIGWVILYVDTRTGKLVNAWIEEHNTGNFSGWMPILVMDVFEHAYMTDYRLERAGYIKAFFENIDWSRVEERARLLKNQS